MSRTKPYSMTEQLKVPLVVGVTGHRDIKDPDSVKKKLDRFWDIVCDLAGEDTEIILLTSIAEGADHLATSSCREKKFKYCVVLPFAEKVYRECFKEQALTDFEEDLNGAYKVITCDAQPKDYSVASDYVRKHCDILLTMWDGYETFEEPSSDQENKPDGAKKKLAKGGTYYQLRTALGLDDLLLSHQEKNHLIINIPVDRSEKGPEHHQEKGEKKICDFRDPSRLSILSPVTKTSAAIADNGDFQKWAAAAFPKQDDEASIASFPANKRLDDFADVLKFIRFHNHKAKTAVLQRPREGERVYYLRKDFMKSEAGKTAMSIVSDDFDRHDYYDSLAEKHQKPHEKQFLWIAVLSIVVGFLGLLWGGLKILEKENHNEWIMHCLIGLYLVGCLCLYWYGRKISRDNHYSLYLQPRIIAEHLRMKIFWKLAGIPGSFFEQILIENSDRGFGVLLCNWEIAEPLPANSKWIEEGNGMMVVKSLWLEDQLKYYDRYLLPDQVHISLDALEDALERNKENRRSTRGFFCFLSEVFYHLKKYYYLFLSPKGWFNDQKFIPISSYFIKYERREACTLFFKKLFFFLGFVMAFFLIVVYIYAKIKGVDHMELGHLKCYRGIMVGVCPFLVASLGWLREKSRWGSIAGQYREMRFLFKKTLNYIAVDSPGHTLESKRQIIKELMMFAHQENAEWNSIKNKAKPEPMW